MCTDLLLPLDMPRSAIRLQVEERKETIRREIPNRRFSRWEETS